MTDELLKGRERARFPSLLMLGLLAFAAVAAVAWIALGSEYAIPILILGAICAAMAIGYRTLAGANRGPSGEADSSESIPAQPANASRPLGDTPEAHDEISPHDIPRDSPGRQAAEHMAGTDDGTTRGMTEGAGTGGTERFRREGGGADEVSAEEASQGADVGGDNPPAR